MSSELNAADLFNKPLSEFVSIFVSINVRDREVSGNKPENSYQCYQQLHYCELRSFFELFRFGPEILQDEVKKRITK